MDILHEIYFYIDSGYRDGFGMTPEQHEEWKQEIYTLFLAGGFAILECDPPCGCCYAVKGQTKLYCHPQELAGPCCDSHIARIERLLKDGRTFRYLHHRVYEQLFDLTPTQERTYYEGLKPEIRQTLLTASDTEATGGYKYNRDILELTAEKFRIRTLVNQNAPDCYTQVQTVIKEVYRELIAEGQLVETPIQVGNKIGAGCKTNGKAARLCMQHK